MKILTLVIATLISVPSLSQSHEDTYLKLRWGTIQGLPFKYRPAKFDERAFVLTISQQTYQFPQFVIDMIEKQATEPKISLHASWYHGGSAYLVIDFFAEENDGYSCHFSLDDLSAMSMTKDTPTAQGYRTDYVKLSDEQLQAIEGGGG